MVRKQIPRLYMRHSVSQLVSLLPHIMIWNADGFSQFTWHRNPNWSRFYSGSEEIWRYFKDVATTYDLEKYVKLNTKVESAVWQEDEGAWKLSLVSSDGTRSEDTCDVLVNGSGVLNSWKYPNIPGIRDFKGKLIHSATWDPSVDLKRKTVAVIGGGSSAVQIVPQIQPSEF
jgi:cation diffusion facilitator CzcD-associated flavoprotein CzcO